MAKTLSELKLVLRSAICEWCPLGDSDEPCTVDTRGPNAAMCEEAKDKRAEYIWENFCDPRLQR